MRLSQWVLGCSAVVMAVVLGGCDPIKAKECEDPGCAPYEHCVEDLGVCELNDCTEDAQCGPGGVCDKTEGVCTTVTDCNCADAFQVCVDGTCTDRYSGITITEPANVTNSTRLAATLNSAGNLPRSDPATLAFTIGSVTGTLPRLDAGYYQGTWSPTADGTYTLTVSGANKTANKQFTLDRTGPTLQFQIPPAPTRHGPGTGLADDIDPTTGFATAYRRDETATIRIYSTNTDVAAAGFQVKVTGVNGTGAGALTTLTSAPDSSCPSGAVFCRVATLDFSAPELTAPRGTFQIVATAVDNAGNSGSVDAGVPVTRFKWSYAGSSQDSIGSPAITAQGDVVVTTRGSSTTGTVYSLSPAGLQRWVAAIGAPSGNAIVGSIDGGMEPIYLATNAGSASAVMLSSSDGGIVSTGMCALAGSTETSPAVHYSSDGVATKEGIVYGVNTGTGRLVSARPTASTVCTHGTLAGTHTPGSAIAVAHGQIYFADETGNVRAFQFNEGPVLEWGPPWPLAIGYPLLSFAASSDAVVIAPQGGVSSRIYAFPPDGGAFGTNVAIPASGWNPSIGDNGTIAVGVSDNTLAVARIGETSLTTGASEAGVIRGAPAWGADGLLYLATAGGEFQAWSPGDVAKLWSDVLPSGAAAGSVALDCARQEDGTIIPQRPGVAYVPAGTTLRAYVVDARGLDTTAPWPKYQHDPRNTGNAATPLAQFACP